MQKGHTRTERYCGNYLTKRVHDLLNIQRDCYIKDVIDSGDDIPFENLDIANIAGYSYCEYCLSNKIVK